MMENEKIKSRFLLSFNSFLFFGSLSSVIPFLVPIALKYSSTSPSKIGLLNTFLPLVTFISKPLFCSFADKYECRKLILLIFLQICTLGFGLLLLLPFGHFSKLTNWIIYCFGLIIAFPSSGIVTSLFDTMIVKHSSKYSYSYGSIRLWGTVGWSFFCLSVGAFDQTQSFLPHYIFGIFVFIFLMVFNSIIIFVFDNDEKEKVLELSQNDISNIQDMSKGEIVQQVVLIFRLYPSLYQFSILIIIIGALTQFHWVFYSVYLHTISNNNSFLISLSIFVQSIIGEIPIFLIADRILKACSPAHTFNISLLAIFFRYIIYNFLIVPEHAYYVLFAELLQGLTFALFVCQMTSLAQKSALKTLNNRKLKGTLQATMQGVFGACFEGFGLGLGALISGSVIENMGILGIWKLGAVVAITTFSFNNIIEFIKSHFSKRLHYQNRSFESLKTFENANL